MTNKVFIFSKTDVSNYVQKKMGLSYLNWAFVVDTLKTNDPDSTYSVKQYPEINLKTGQLTGRKVNYFAGINGNDAYVTVTVEFRNHKQTESLPCYDFKGRATRVPDAMLVNKTIKRCYVKAAAILTGLGISLYINGKAEPNENNFSNNSNGNWNGNVRQNNGSQRPAANSQGSHSQNGNHPKEPQPWVLKNIKKQLETKQPDDDPKTGKLFKSLYASRNDLEPAINQIADMKHCSPAAAAYDVGKKYLDKLPAKQQHQASDTKISDKELEQKVADNDLPF